MAGAPQQTNRNKHAQYIVALIGGEKRPLFYYGYIPSVQVVRVPTAFECGTAGARHADRSLHVHVATARLVCTSAQPTGVPRLPRSTV